MKKTFLFLPVILVMGLVLCHSASSQEVEHSLRTSSTALTGRYQLVVPGELMGLAVLLDTTTGKTWHQVQYTNLEGKPSLWVPTAERVDNYRELEAWLAKQTPAQVPK